MPVMPYKTWMQRTYVSIVSSRSKQIEAVDKALLEYEAKGSKLEDARIVLTRLNDWKKWKGPAWKESERNKNKAIENLSQQLETVIFGRGRPDASLAGDLKLLREAQKSEAKRLFASAKLELKTTYEANNGFTNLETLSLANGGRKIYKGAVAAGAPSLSADRRAITGAIRRVATDDGLSRGGGHPGVVGSTLHMLTTNVKDEINKAIAAHIPSKVLGEAMTWLQNSGMVGEFIAHLVKAMTPFAGALTSGGSAIFSAFKAAREAWRISEVSDHTPFILPGNGRAAVAAMSRLMERTQDQNLRSAALSAAQCAGQVLTTLLDVSGATQAIIGAAGAIASISHKLFLVGRDFVERYDANVYLASATGVDAKIFEVHPILGCYFVLFSSSSSILNFSDSFGSAGWREEVEWMNKNHLVPLRELALKYIEDSRFHLVSTGTGSIENRFFVPEMGLRTELEASKMAPHDAMNRYGRSMQGDFSGRSAASSRPRPLVRGTGRVK